jgi:hypothetical protein
MTKSGTIDYAEELRPDPFSDLSGSAVIERLLALRKMSALRGGPLQRPQRFSAISGSRARLMTLKSSSQRIQQIKRLSGSVRHKRHISRVVMRAERIPAPSRPIAHPS